MLQPNRHNSSNTYRYGFQGQENDNELKGDGLSVNYKYRMHDPRLGRFFAVDPLAGKYTWLTPYQFSSNTPIGALELEGLEADRQFNNIENTEFSFMDHFLKSFGLDDLLSGFSGPSGDPEEFVKRQEKAVLKLKKGTEAVETIGYAIGSFPVAYAATWGALVYGTPVVFSDFTLKAAGWKFGLSLSSELLFSNQNDGTINLAAIGSDTLLTPGFGRLVGTGIDVDFNIKSKDVTIGSVFTGEKSASEFGIEFGTSLLFSGKSSILTKYAPEMEAHKLGEATFEAAQKISEKAVEQGVKEKVLK